MKILSVLSTSGAPNFDGIIGPEKSLKFDPLTASFFNRDQSYFFRAKAHLRGTRGIAETGGTWGEWSAPVEFKVSLPARPLVVAEALPEGRMRLAWQGEPGTEYLIFGSQRLDFLPEIYGAEEMVLMRNGQVEQSRPNKNLLAVVTDSNLETV